MAKLTLRILLPGREAVNREVDSFNVTGLEGELGILPGHAALLAALKPGPAWFKDGAEIDRWALGDGFLEVHDDLVTVLVQTAEHSSEIDVERARNRKDEIERRIKSETMSEIELRRLEASLAKQLARLQVAGVPVG
jgi:F-type H+-transporting ATPase subunit epsilon